LFEPFLDWVNDDLAKAKLLALHGNPGYATWARLLRDDTSSEPLRGGGFLLDFSAWADGPPREKPEERCILLPCCVP
jgi:hypothetical protein